MRYPIRIISAALLSGGLTLSLPIAAQQPGPAPNAGGTWQKFGTRPSQNQAAAQDPPATYTYEVPATLVLPAGTWITLRVNEPLSSDFSQPGDAFTATLSQPLAADGLLIGRGWFRV